MSPPLDTSKCKAPQQVEAFLNECNLAQYCDLFIEEGFDRMESLLEITEIDLMQMGVKRGHRRLLQRAIANARGFPPALPLIIDTEYGTAPRRPHRECNVLYDSSTGTTELIHRPHSMAMGGVSSQNGMSSTEDETVISDNIGSLWKRKYQRHAEPDKNAPLKPPSAYVKFSNEVRAELKNRNMTFTELAKAVGDRWKNLCNEEKERYNSDAERDKKGYEMALEQYRMTDEYKIYQEYLTNFKAKHEAASRSVGKPRKRHRRDIPKDIPSNDSALVPSHSTISTSQSNGQRNKIYSLLNNDTSGGSEKSSASSR